MFVVLNSASSPGHHIQPWYRYSRTKGNQRSVSGIPGRLTIVRRWLIRIFAGTAYYDNLAITPGTRVFFICDLMVGDSRRWR